MSCLPAQATTQFWPGRLVRGPHNRWCSTSSFETSSDAGTIHPLILAARIGPRHRRLRQRRVRPAEVGRRRVLADADDAAADRARAGEVVEQELAVAAADRAGELGEI